MLELTCQDYEADVDFRVPHRAYTHYYGLLQSLAVTVFTVDNWASLNVS
jgi:hypothetical protein